MTVILALLTQEGIVFASDSRETFNQGVRRVVHEPIQKIFPLGDSILYGMAGGSGMAQKVTEELEKALKRQPELFKRPVSDLKLRLRGWIFPTMLHTIFCGWTDNKYWILEIDPQGDIEEHTHRGFCAAGSGGSTSHFAVQCLAHLEINTRKLYQGQVVAYRIIDDVIRRGDPSVGGDVQIFVLTNDGVRRIDGAELRKIQNLVGIWKEIEKESLGKLKEPGENP